MSRKPKTKPAAPTDELEPAAGAAPEERDPTSGGPSEPPAPVAADPDVAPPPGALVRVPAAGEGVPGRLAGVALDCRNGIRVDVERERRPGTPAPRVLVRFADDRPPSADEKRVLRAEGFAYAVADKAWAAPLSAAALVVAKRAVNAITRARGDGGAGLYV